jgi:hypothetical protein
MIEYSPSCIEEKIGMGILAADKKREEKPLGHSLFFRQLSKIPTG